MTGPTFLFSDLFHEIEALRVIAKDFLADGATDLVLPRVKHALAGIQEQRTGSKFTWEIPVAKPLRTRPSFGDYAQDGQGELNVFGELSFIWEIAPIVRRGPILQFRLDGIASTLIKLRQLPKNGDVNTATELAAWRIEIGSHDSPGTHFHVQMNSAHDAPTLPKTLDVPRLPTFAMTPFLAVESLLAELFQKDWNAEAFRGGSSLQQWNSVQRQRIESFLDWQRDGLKKRTNGSPWAVLKSLKPELGDALSK